MSRKKKVKDAILKKHRKNQTKQSRANKPKYISKADREKMELEAEQASDNLMDSATSEE
ncbi:hypothetical protein VF_A0294 [Aliivibrio fischeri ES114]|uniref:DUF2986 domain-containing protein n=1 Tax=Aliivibrio fischeri (strain ATCC 700601 / ES114) TaxID=312309 RepID=Q5E0T2_ALIF1|nr:DUF2986 domain-containing protein [Aliivibrio fischeri]AAW87364.1 hypothetical protein VF_A0294 [Aliivibrio fischeri ES114]KLU77998.1 hypothetical protein AB192_14805 [Aliivibrio fischeri]MCE7568109.1 DUF2986 domain-containing protein [Aliivibrio fischeri]MCE7577154.1 DUF2986 domain-containing protein [Aliivibrio fischeri]MCE7589443.1 DUF2986 domain-containing protein [Aliivibrio fischeri]